MVESDDAVTPNLSLTVSMNILVELGFETPSLRFADASVGTEARQSIKLVGTALAEAKLGAVSSDVDGLTARVVESKEASGTSTTLEVVLKAQKAGNLRGTVRIATSVPTLPSLTLPVFAQVKGDVTVTPGFVAIEANAPDKVYTVTVTSRRPGLKITAVADASGFLAGKAVADKDGAWRVDLSLTPKARTTPDVFTTTVRLSTNHPDEPLVEVSASRGGAGPRQLSREPGRRPLPPMAKPHPAAAAAPAATPP